MAPPLFVHLVFHPRSKECRALARAIHRSLSGDPQLPGLRVPTVIMCEDGTELPPPTHALHEAVRSMVVVLADDEMVIEPAAPPSPGRKLWGPFVADLAAACELPRRRFLPIQMSQAAWPLDPLLDGMTFAKAFLEPAEQRTAWVIRRVLIELSRLLMGEAAGDKLPMRLFLSHAKGDIAREPTVFAELAAHLDATQPVRAWIDSADIDAGSRFANAIAQGVQDSVLMVLATRSYGARPWCRREVLLSKRHRRPFVVIEALKGLDERAFPYWGNAPRLRWTPGGAADAVELLLRETLRYLHVGLVLEAQKRFGDCVLSTPPDLSALVRLDRGCHVLYPDPPIGDEELEEIAPLGMNVATPLQRAADGRALGGVSVLLSISESGDAERNGLLPEQLDEALLEISLQLLVRGASLEYGGHLGSAGYTTALFDMVWAYRATSNLPPPERIVNDVGWPLPLAALPADVRARNQVVATYRRIPRPQGVEDLGPKDFVEEPKFFPADSPERRYAWARGMTAMREAQATGRGLPGGAGVARGRVVLGGKVGPTESVQPDGKRERKWYLSRIPGVVEEALVSLRASQPVYLVGAFGGAARLVIDLLEGRPRADFTWTFHRDAPHAVAMRKLYDARGPAWEDYPEMADYLTELGVAGLASINRLTVEQNRELFTTRDASRIVALVIEGLTNTGTPAPLLE